MKFSIKPVAIAVTVALASAVAHAQTIPTMGAGNAYDGGSNDGLYLAIWDNSSLHTDVVSLTSLYSDVAFNSGGTSVLTTPTPGSDGWSTATNFDGFASVDQLNLGTVSNFSSVFGTPSSTTFYEVVAGNTTATGVVSTAPLNNAYTGAALVNQDKSIVAESASWNSYSSTGPEADTAGTAAFNVVTGDCSATLCDGEENTGVQQGVNVGTAAAFFNYAKTSARNPTVTTEYSYNGQAGFFFLSDTGDLTWNLIASSVSSVPLPPAVWLFASGLIGLGLIGRRRQGNLGPAV
jgi:hypothetical protein